MFALLGSIDGGGVVRGVSGSFCNGQSLDREAARVSLQPLSQAVMVAIRSAALISALARR